MRLYEPRLSPPFTEQKCTNELDQLLKHSPKVAILLKGIQTLSKDALLRGVTCRNCAGTLQEGRMGYYDASYKRVVICCNSIRNKQELEDTLTHELTHAFDSKRKGKFKSICHLIACGEVRASALGQCADIKDERKRYSCIYNDAFRSTELHCGSEQAEKVVKQVFKTCINDTSPFQ